MFKYLATEQVNFRLKNNYFQKKTITTERNSTSTDENFVDDLIHTPHPAQSTLNLNGRPLTRLTEFRRFEANESSSSNKFQPLKKNKKHAVNTSKKDKDINIEKSSKNEHNSVHQAGTRQDISTSKNNMSIQKEQQLQLSSNR
jgi:hypothetical protein